MQPIASGAPESLPPAGAGEVIAREDVREDQQSPWSLEDHRAWESALALGDTLDPESSSTASAGSTGATTGITRSPGLSSDTRVLPLRPWPLQSPFRLSPQPPPLVAPRASPPPLSQLLSTLRQPVATLPLASAAPRPASELVRLGHGAGAHPRPSPGDRPQPSSRRRGSVSHRRSGTSPSHPYGFVVKSVEILHFQEQGRAMHYQIAVNASEGRRWTVWRSYSDFRELEQRTWRIRGPMPPFPYPWEGLQVLLHLFDAFTSRTARVSMKMGMLDAWLKCLVQRARKAPKLQSVASAFLDVLSSFEQADSKLLQQANNVTSLVLTNPQANVEDILLRLSSKAEDLSSRRGKRALTKAREGPMLVPPLLVDLDRIPQHITFDLSLERPTVQLLVRNNFSASVAFKVMATEVTRYFVSPSQVALPAGGEDLVSIFMPDPEGAVEASASFQDRFMFVMVPLGVELAPGEALSRGELARVWHTCSREQFARRKVNVRFCNALAALSPNRDCDFEEASPAAAVGDDAPYPPSTSTSRPSTSMSMLASPASSMSWS